MSLVRWIFNSFVAYEMMADKDQCATVGDTLTKLSNYGSSTLIQSK